MTDAIVRLVSRLTPERLLQLFATLAIGTELPTGPGNAAYRKAAHDAVLNASDSSRMRFEGIAGRVIAFTEREDFGDLALRSVCQNSPDLMEILETGVSPEERAVQILLTDRRSFDRASSLAAGHRWRGGRQHCLFNIPGGGEVAETIDQAVEAISSAVMALHGKRKVDKDHFVYPDLFDPEAIADPSQARLKHHIAIYLEAPASYWLEFPEGQTHMVPVNRSEAKEIAIDYDPRSGELHTAGRGIGGSRVLEEVAKIFGKAGLAQDKFERAQRTDLQLGMFRAVMQPILTPPAGFTGLTVEELCLRAQRSRSSLVTYKGGEGRDAYARLRELGTKRGMLGGEKVRSVTVALRTPARPDESPRTVRVTLNWPNSIIPDGATPAERRDIIEWAAGLRNPPWQPDSTLAEWVEQAITDPAPAPRSSFEAMDKNLTAGLLALGILKRTGSADEIPCPSCDEDHPCPIRLSDDGPECFCLRHDWQPVDPGAIELARFDRVAFVSALARAAAGVARPPLADRRLVRLSVLNTASGQRMWSLFFADGVSDSSVMSGVIRALQLEDRRGLVVTTSDISMDSPLPNEYRFAPLERIFRLEGGTIWFDADAALGALGQRSEAPGKPGPKPNRMEVAKRLFLELRLTPDWPEGDFTAQAKRIHSAWPQDDQSPPANKVRTIAGQISRHGSEWIAESMRQRSLDAR